MLFLWIRPKIDVSTNERQAMTHSFSISKAQASTHTGRIVTVWNVIDADGYVWDSFDTKRDARAWIELAHSTK